jgi:Fe-S cluster assembly iron-binding protein IscA
MINVSESAQQELTKYFADKEVQPIRVHLADGGCAGPRLSLALDEPRDGDKSVEQGAFTFLINEELATASGAVSIDMSEYGFVVESENQIGGGGCGCASSGSCGSAGSGGCGC